MKAETSTSFARVPIMVIHRDRKVQRMLHRILAATLHAVDILDDIESAAEVLQQRVPTLIVLDHRCLIDPRGHALIAEAAQRGTAACLVLVGGADTPDLPHLFGMGSLTNLLGSPMPVLAEELTATVLKLLRGDIFGLEKYLAWGVETRTVALENAGERSSAVDMLTSDVRDLGFGPRISSLASLVADELLSNALYNAPVDASGARQRVNESRHSDRQLLDRERVKLRYACDGRYLAIEVTDLFGSIKRRTILEYLAKCAGAGGEKVDFKRTGAGMGIGLVYSSCNHLVFNLEPGQRTEVIGLIEVRFQPAELRTMVSSFNVFVREGKGTP